MFYNKLILGGSGIILIGYCVHFRLPVVFLIESLLMLKFSFETNFIRIDHAIENLQNVCKVVGLREKIKLIDESYKTKRNLKYKLGSMFLINVYMLGASVYYNYPKPEITQRLLYNIFFFFACFPYLSKNFQRYSNINWMTLSYLWCVIKILPTLKVIVLIILIGLNMISTNEIPQLMLTSIILLLILNSFYRIGIYSLLMNILQIIIIVILTIDYMNFDYELNQGYFTLFDEKDQFILILYALTLWFSFITDMLSSIEYFEREIAQNSLIDKDVLIVMATLKRKSMTDSFDDRNQSGFLSLQSIQIEPPSDFKLTLFRLMVAFFQLYQILIVTYYRNFMSISIIVWIFIASITRDAKIVVQGSFLVLFASMGLLIHDQICYFQQLGQCESETLIFLWINILSLSGIRQFYLIYYSEILINEGQFRQPKQSFIYIIWATILRNSYTLSLILLFCISSQKVNLINTFLLIITILFIVKHEGHQQSEISYRNRHWIKVVILTNIIIILNYIYYLDDEQNQWKIKLYELLGLNKSQFVYYLYWILDFFVVLQYETYKSKIYDDFKNQFLSGKFETLNKLRQILLVIYRKLILWICYMLIVIILGLWSLNAFDFLEYVAIFRALYISISDNIYGHQSHVQIKLYWNIYLSLVGFFTLFRYISDFMKLLLNVYQFSFLQNEYVSMIFLLQQNNDPKYILGFSRLAFNIMALCLGYLGKDYLSYLERKVEQKQDIEMKNLSEPLMSNDQEIKEKEIKLTSKQILKLTNNSIYIRQITKGICKVFPTILYFWTIYLSVYYQLSFAMLFYLAILFQYIYQSRQQFREQLVKNKIDLRLNEKIMRWRFNFIKSVESKSYNSKIFAYEDYSLVNTFMNIIKFIDDISRKKRQELWLLVIKVSLVMYLLTLLSQIFPEYSDILFAIGIYSNKNETLFKYTFPYISAIIMVVIDTRCQSYLQDHQLIDNKPFILRPNNQFIDRQKYLRDNYYTHKYQSLLINIKLSILHSVQKLYLLILFFFAAITDGIFSLIYVILFALVFFIHQRKNKNMINVVSIMILLVQYFSYLITLSAESSPIQAPDGFDFMRFTSESRQLIEYLKLNGGEECKRMFLFNCIIIYGVWVIYYFQEVFSLKIITFIDNCYLNYKLQDQSQISSQAYLIIKRTYTIAIVYANLFIEVLVLLYYSKIDQKRLELQFLNLTMFILTICYIFYTEILQENRILSQRIEFQKLFIAVQQYAIIIIFLAQFIYKFSFDITVKDQKQQLWEIGTFYLLSIGRDLITSKEYFDVMVQYTHIMDIRAKMIGLSMSYEANNKKLQKLINRFKVRKELRRKIDAISQMMDIHNSLIQSRIKIKREKEYSFKIQIFRWIDDHRNRYFFQPTKTIFQNIVYQNMRILQLDEQDIKDIDFQHYKNILQYLEIVANDIQSQLNENFQKDVYLQQVYNDNLQIIQFCKLDIIDDNKRILQFKQEPNNLENLITKRVIIVLVQFLLTYWHFFCFYIMIHYYFYNHGILSMILPIGVFAYGVIEEQQPSKYLWIVSFLYISLLSILSLFVDMFEQLKFQTMVGLVFGTLYPTEQWAILLAILIQINIMKNIGLFNNIITEHENIVQAILRFLLNGSQKIIRQRSKSQDEQQMLDHRLNRAQNMITQIYQVLQLLEKEFFEHFDEVQIQKRNFFYNAFSNMKPGKDIYPFVAAAQLMVLIFIFFFYEQVVSSESISILENFKNNLLSGNMVMALLFWIICIFVDRVLVQQKRQGEELLDVFFHGGKRKENTTPEVEQTSMRHKYYFQIVLLIFLGVNFILIINQSSSKQDSNFLKVFYILFCLYFFFSAMQIKYGINDMRMQNTLMQGYKAHNLVIFNVYKAVPFLFELKTLCDWAFSATSLTLFQWIKLEEIHALLFQARCNAYYLKNKKVGSTIPFYNKCFLGFCCIILLLGLLVGPLFLYSPLNPTFLNDDLIGASMKLGLRGSQWGYTELFINEEKPFIYKLTDVQYKNLTQTFKFLKKYDQDSMQIVKFNNYSDYEWKISNKGRNMLMTQEGNMSLEVLISFNRYHTNWTEEKLLINYKLNDSQELQIKQLSNNSNTKIKLNNFYPKYLRIDQNKEIQILNDTGKPINLTYIDNTWYIESGSEGMQFLVVSDKYSSALLGYSIMGFYITIVYVAGKLARGVVSGRIELIHLLDMPNPEDLIVLCEAITIARVEKDLVQEELYYFQLIDLIRSPQVMIQISGSFLQQRKDQLAQE